MDVTHSQLRISLQTFRRNLQHSSSGSKSKRNKQEAERAGCAFYVFFSGCFLRLPFDPIDVESTFLRNVCELRLERMTSTKILHFIVTAVRTWTPAQLLVVLPPVAYRIPNLYGITSCKIVLFTSQCCCYVPAIVSELHKGTCQVIGQRCELYAWSSVKGRFC